MHGKISAIHHEGKGVFRGLNDPFDATRYHSLVIERESLPDCLELTAWTENEDGFIRGNYSVRHRELAGGSSVSSGIYSKPAWPPDAEKFPGKRRRLILETSSMSQATILKKILDRKVEEVAERQTKLSLADLEYMISEVDTSRGFADALVQRITQKRPAVIAEIKKASPSKGLIREDFEPAAIAQSYADNGAACLSILTDKDFFQGDEEYLKLARAACKLPVIRKDFMIDPGKLPSHERLALTAFYLLVAALSEQQLRELAECARQYSIDFQEVHSREELELALSLMLALWELTNRDLHNFSRLAFRSLMIFFPHTGRCCRDH